MTTSGTIGATVIETRKVLEHAIRRVGIPAAGQTPEIVQIALDNLFLLLLNLSSKGLNLWAVDKQIVPIVAGQLKYVMPAGTIDVLNMSYARNTYITGINTTTPTDYTVTLPSATVVQRVGFNLSVLPLGNLSVQNSNDGVTWSSVSTILQSSLPVAGAEAYYDIDIQTSGVYWRLYASGLAFTATLFELITGVSELPITQMNRDDYSALPNKFSTGSIAVNYYFEKLVNPQVNLWPVPNDSTAQLVVWRHRQPQDVGSLGQTLEIPNRWFETIIWNLSARLCFEIPQIPAEKVTQVLTENAKYQDITENGENDGAPIYFVSNISGYTR